MKKIQIILLLLAGFFASGQEFKLGKVSRAELEQKFHPADTAAPAAILYKKGHTYFTLDMDGYWSMITEVECRIKIYKKEGYEYATDKLYYYTGGKTLKVYYSDAYTYNLVDGKIEKTRLKGEGEFKDKVQENFNQKTITMPNVKEGSVIEYKYTIVTPYFTVFREWYFQYDIPANYVSYEIAIPLYFTYNRFISGYIKPEQSETKVQLGSGSMFNESVVTFTAKDVKAIKDGDYVNNIRNYTSILMHELASTNFPSGKEDYATDWASVTKRIYDDEDFGRELGYTSYFKEDLNLLLAGATTQAEKMNIIFNYVKNRMNWNGDASYYCEKGVKKAYEDKVGNAAEINLMLTAMLREAGITANPVLVSTRAHGVAMFPNRAAYNYVITAVENGKDIILFDATSKYTTANILPLRALNWVGRMIRKDGTSLEVELTPKINSRDIVNISAALAGDGKVSGKARIQHYDYNAYVFRENYAGTNPQNYASLIEKRHTGIEISGYSSDEKDLSKPAVEEYSFVHGNMSDIIGDKIYISPLLFFTEEQTPFKKETREYPIDFPFPYQDKYMINITIPEGYTVESLPKSMALAMEENIGTFKYNIATKGNMIQIGIVLDINYSNVSKDYYPTVRDFFRKMTDKQNEKIVLKKT